VKREQLSLPLAPATKEHRYFEQALRAKGRGDQLAARYYKDQAFNQKRSKTMKTPKIYRQGDVLLRAVAAIPQGAKDVTPEGRIVLAYGEVTGHAHAIDDAPPAVKPKLWDAGAERFLQVVETTSLKHEEHAPVEIAPGNYQVINQVEYAPEEIRRVAD